MIIMKRNKEFNINEAKLKVAELEYKINSLIEEFIKGNSGISIVPIGRDIPEESKNFVFWDNSKDDCFFQLLGVYSNF